MALKKILKLEEEAVAEGKKLQESLELYYQNYEGLELNVVAAAKASSNLIGNASGADSDPVRRHPLDGQLASLIGRRVSGSKAFALFMLQYGLLCIDHAGLEIGWAWRNFIAAARSHGSSKAFLKLIAPDEARIVAVAFQRCLDGDKLYVAAFIEAYSSAMLRHPEVSEKLISKVLFAAFASPTSSDLVLHKQLDDRRKEVKDSWKSLRGKLPEVINKLQTPSRAR